MKKYIFFMLLLLVSVNQKVYTDNEIQRLEERLKQIIDKTEVSIVQYGRAGGRVGILSDDEQKEIKNFINKLNSVLLAKDMKSFIMLLANEVYITIDNSISNYEKPLIVTKIGADNDLNHQKYIYHLLFKDYVDQDAGGVFQRAIRDTLKYIESNERYSISIRMDADERKGKKVTFGFGKHLEGIGFEIRKDMKSGEWKILGIGSSGSAEYFEERKLFKKWGIKRQYYEE